MSSTDDLYPNDGQYFTLSSPTDQTDDTEQEANDVLSALPVLQEIVKHFSDLITFYDSVSAVPEEVRTSPEDFMHTVSANAMVVENLKRERNYIETLSKEYIQTLK